MTYDNIATFQASPLAAGWTVPAGVETAISFALKIIQPGTLNGWQFSLQGVPVVRFENFVRDRAFLGGPLPLAVAGTQILRAFVNRPAGTYLLTGGGTYRYSGTGSGEAAWPITLTPPPRLIVTGAVVDPPPNNNDSAGLNLTWLQASFLASTGAKIRRAGWKDRYLESTTGIWWLQLINAVTGVAGVRAVVQSTDWTVENFRALDWTCDAPEAAALAAARLITTTYP